MSRSIFCVLFCLALGACGGGNGSSSEESSSSVSSSSTSSEAASSSSQAQARCSDEQAEANRTTARDALEQFFIQKDMSAIDRFWKDPYTQHNPVAQSGVENFRNVFESFLSSIEYEIYGVWAECDLAVVLGRYGGTGIIFDMFRLDDGKFMEHWDSDGGQASANINGAVFSISDLDETHNNREHIMSLYEDILIPGGDNITTQSVGAYFDESRLLSADYFGQISGRDYKEIHYVIADGNFVFVLAEATVNGQTYAIYDLYRLESGLAVEYWHSRRVAPSNPSAGFPGIF